MSVRINIDLNLRGLAESNQNIRLAQRQGLIEKENNQKVSSQGLDTASSFLQVNSVNSNRIGALDLSKAGFRSNQWSRIDQKPAARRSAQEDAGYPVAAFWFLEDVENNEICIRSTDFNEEVRYAKSTVYQDLNRIQTSESYVFTGDCFTGNAVYTRQAPIDVSVFDSLLLWFPVGKDKCLVAYTESGIFATADVVQTYSGSWENISAIFPISGELFAPQRIYDQISTVDNLRDVSYYSLKTWLVWRSGIKEVSVPDVFAEKMKQYLPDYRNGTPSIAKTLIGGTNVNSTSFSEGSSVPQNSCDVFSPTGHDYEDLSPITGNSALSQNVQTAYLYEPTSPPSAEGFTLNFSVTYSELIERNDLTIDLTGISSDYYYDADRINLIFFGSYNYVRGPGATYVLNNKDASFEPGSSPEDIKTTFFAEANQPNISFGYEGLFPPNFRFGYYKILGYPYYSGFEGDPLRSKVADIREPTAPEYISEEFELLYCWDWDRSAYCRQQLLDLGFQSEDLTP